jgi:hypothetical protein
MALLFLVLACSSSPTVTVQSSAHPDAPMPGNLAEVMERQIQRPIHNCYVEALKTDSSLEGAVSYEVLGSHGILKAKLTGAENEALETCALKPMSNQRLLRTLGDGANTVGFTLTIRFAAG